MTLGELRGLTEDVDDDTEIYFYKGPNHEKDSVAVESVALVKPLDGDEYIFIQTANG